MFTFALTVGISLGVTCLCSILEAVLLSLSATDLAEMNEKRPRASYIWQKLKDNIHQPIAVILIVNTFAHTIGASLSGAQFDQLFGHKWIWVYSIIYSLVMIQWTEILPKSLAVRHNQRFAGIFSGTMKLLMLIFAPAVKVVDLLNKPFAPKYDNPEKIDTLDDIAILANYALRNRIITDRQEKIVERSLALSSIDVHDIMIPREEIKFLTVQMNLAEALVEAHIHHHTRFPLIDENEPDRVIGYVNFKDIVSALQLNPKDPSLRGICRPMISVDIEEPVSILLNRLIKSYQHIAVVKDSLGKVRGLVTLEDVIETIIGEINDEYDLLPGYFYQIAQNRFIVGGGVGMARLSSEFCRPLAEQSISLDEWLRERIKRTPRAEDTVEHEGVVFGVRKVSRSQIHEVVITVKT
jgi:CBS domain containing-hemolysin-like protein